MFEECVVLCVCMVRRSCLDGCVCLYALCSCCVCAVCCCDVSKIEFDVSYHMFDIYVLSCVLYWVVCVCEVFRLVSLVSLSHSSVSKCCACVVPELLGLLLLRTSPSLSERIF